MRIGLDYTYGVDACSGIGRYANRLARAFVQTASVDDTFSLFFIDFLRHFKPEVSCPECAGDPRFSFVPARLLPARVYERLWNIPVLRNLPLQPHEKVDLFHITSHAALPVPRSAKLVCTIHDMAAWRFPAHGVMAKDRRAIRLNAKRADAIITDSTFSADDIVRFIPEAQGKVFPIHLAIDHETYFPQSEKAIAAMRKALGLEKPYILTVGLVHKTKNQGFLGKVLDALDRDDIELVIAGAPSYTFEEVEAELKALHRTNQVKLLGRVDDRWLPALYSGAALYATASLSEGFGFTPLEAMACGTPVVSSAAGSLPEVLGNTADILTDFDIDHWRNTIARLLDAASYRAKRIQEGLNWTQRFTWTRTAKETLKIYRSLTDNR